MKPVHLTFLLAFVTAVTALAQTATDTGGAVVHLKNGTTISSSEVSRVGDQIFVTVLLGNAGKSQMRYPIGIVNRIDFPKPAGIENAEHSLAANDPKAALATIQPVIARQSAFQDIPGNFWTTAALIAIKAQVALGRYKEAEKSVDALAEHAEPETLRLVRIEIAIGWTKEGKIAQARAVFDDTIDKSKSPRAVALAWVGKGDTYLAEKNFDDALLAYLRVPIFFPLEDDAMPLALLGSARAYLRLDEKDRAHDILQQIVTTYPTSAAAATAKAELLDLDEANARKNQS